MKFKWYFYHFIILACASSADAEKPLDSPVTVLSKYWFEHAGAKVTEVGLTYFLTVLYGHEHDNVQYNAWYYHTTIAISSIACSLSLYRPIHMYFILDFQVLSVICRSQVESSSTSVRYSLANMCSMLISDCWLALSASRTVLLDTTVVLSCDLYDHVRYCLSEI